MIDTDDERRSADQAFTGEAPEVTNREQDDAATQAQTVADDAIRGLANDQAGESDKMPSGDAGGIVPDDAQDVVDHMQQMERSGVVDYDAFRGERSDDDEASNFGNHETDDHTVRLSDE